MLAVYIIVGDVAYKYVVIQKLIIKFFGQLYLRIGLFGAARLRGRGL